MPNASANEGEGLPADALLGESDRRLRYFMTIAALGSMSKAAEALDISQPSLSRQISLLETHLGQPVFERTGRGMALTAVGEELYRAAASGFKLIDDAVARIRDMNVAMRGVLKIAAVHTLTYYLLGDLVSVIAHEGQGANLQLMARSSPEVVDLVASGKAELGFVYDSAVAVAGLASVDLFDDEMCLIVRQEHESRDRIDIWQETQRLVVFPPHYALRRMLQHSKLDYVASAETDTVDAALELVSAGMGTCLLPRRIPDRLLSDYKLRKVAIAGPQLARKVVAIHREGRRLSPLAALALAIAHRLSRRTSE